ncbi:anthranilate synthase component II [Eubacterium sp.]
MVLLIDNYDSFSYNVVSLIGTLTKGDIEVKRNDEITIEEIENMNPSYIVLSPGPGKPRDAGICQEVIKAFKGKIPILGICLGHQCICEVFGATVTYAKNLMHGKQSLIEINNDKIFENLENPIKGARYHSLAAKKDSIPEELEVIARSMDDNEIMAVKHRKYDIYGLQFHPESILTPEGDIIVNNFLNIRR